MSLMFLIIDYNSY